MDGQNNSKYRDGAPLKKQTSNPNFAALASQLEGYVGYPVPVNPENEQEYQQSRLKQTPVHS